MAYENLQVMPKLDPNKEYTIEELTNYVRNAVVGENVREALARSMEATNEIATWARDVAQGLIDGAFDAGELATMIESKLNQLEQDYAPNLTSLETEVGDARANYDNLAARLLDFDSQLAQKVSQEELSTKLDSEKVPLKLSRVNGFASGETMYNSTAFVQDNLTTYNGYQYMIYTDSYRHPIVGKRKLPDGEWTLFDLSTLLNNNLRSPTQLDEHNVYAIAVDKEGYIHISGNYHATVINYVRSTYPENITQWTGYDGGYMTGIEEDVASYPHFVKRKDGELLFFYRNGNTDQATTQINIYDTATKTWSKLVNGLTGVPSGTIDYPYFNRIAVGKDGVIHFSGCFRMNGYNADIFYMKSLDGGSTWVKSDGSPQTLPMTHNNAEIIKQIDGSGNGLLNQNGMEVDENGNPHIVYFRNDNNGHTNIFHLYYNGTSWTEKQVTNFKKTLASDLVSWTGEMSRPSIFTIKNRVFIIYRVNYAGKKGTVRMVEVTPNIEQYIDFPILNLDLYAWEPSFDTQALYERNELHLMIVPCTTDYARYNDLISLDSWEQQFLGVLSIDLNQIDKVIRKEVHLPYMRVVHSLNGLVKNSDTPNGVLTIPIGGVPLIENSNILYAKLITRGATNSNTKITIRVKDINLDGTVTVSYYHTMVFDKVSGSVNKTTPFRPIINYDGNAFIEVEGDVELFNGASVGVINISSIFLELVEIVY